MAQSPEQLVPGRFRELLRAVRLTSSSTLLTVVFGVASNKLIAHYAGSSGIGLIGIYRTLVYLASTVGLLGVTDVMTRGIARAKTKEESTAIIGASAHFLVLPVLVVLLVAFFFAAPITSAMFGSSGSEHVDEVRVVLALSSASMGYAVVQAILNGQAAVREIASLSVAVSFATLALSYPFLKIGPLGLPLLISVGPFAAMLLGVRFTWKRNGLRAADFGFRSIAEVRARLPISLFLVLHPFVATTSALAHQSVMARGYGIDTLGLYNAGSTLESTAIAMLTAPMRSYFLPTLGRLESHVERRRFAERMLVVLLALILVGGSILILGAPEILSLLFARAFTSGASLVAALALSFVGQMFVWVAGMHLIHEGRFGTWVAVDTVWALLRVGGTYACVRYGAPIVAAAFVHAGAYTVLGVIYVFVTREKGVALISGRAIGTSLAVLALLGAASWLATSRTAFGIGVYVACAGAFAWSLARRWK
ncbi:MAG: oligosaccharide flippase family protein [Labilithrix sp.]|nr:oligosaccharide flippase family protein [Labilithrix sp.]